MNKSDVTRNNWLLPVRGEYFKADSMETAHRMQVREQGMQIEIGWTQAKTFNDLNEKWWPNYFSQFGFKELVEKAKQLGVKPVGGKAKGNYVLALTEHYRARFQ